MAALHQIADDFAASHLSAAEGHKETFGDSVAVHRRLKEHGVAIVNDLADSPFGKTFTFRDPDGHLFTVHDGG